MKTALFFVLVFLGVIIVAAIVLTVLTLTAKHLGGWGILGLVMGLVALMGFLLNKSSILED